MHIPTLLILALAGCSTPTEPTPGTQVGDEGDDRTCIEQREVLTDLDQSYGGLDMTAAEFLALARVPVSGVLAFPDGDETLTLSLTPDGTVWFAHDEPVRDDIDPADCTGERYYAQVSGSVSAANLLDESFTSEASSFQPGHVFVSALFDVTELTGSLSPNTLDLNTWDTVELHIFGGSTDGIWTIHLDWDAYIHDPYETERESIVDGSLRP